MSEYLGCRDFMNPYWFNYGKYIAQDQLVILVAMTFAVIAPLILIPCLCFFAMAILVYRHQLLWLPKDLGMHFIVFLFSFGEYGFYGERAF